MIFYLYFYYHYYYFFFFFFFFCLIYDHLVSVDLVVERRDYVHSTLTAGFAASGQSAMRILDIGRYIEAAYNGLERL